MGLIRSAGERMREDLAERFVDHPGELGAGREEIIREFLRTYLPKRYDVSTGFAFDALGNVSQQLDIIISDALIGPRFETRGGIRYHPCETVLAVGQVKSSITSSDVFSAALDNLASAKRLDRSARGEALDYRFGEPLDPRNNYLDQIFTFLIVSGKMLRGPTAREEYLNYMHSRPAEVWTNIILSLDRFLITFFCENGVCPNAMDARGIYLARPSNDDNLLINFYVLLARALEVTRRSSLPYWQHLETAMHWSGDVIHGEVIDTPTGTAPRLLRDLTGG